MPRKKEPAAKTAARNEPLRKDDLPSKRAKTKSATTKGAAKPARSPAKPAKSAATTGKRAGGARSTSNTESKAPARAASSRRPIKRETPKPVGAGALRTLGDVKPVRERAEHPGVPDELCARARDVLREQFDRAIGMQEKMRAESSIGAKEKGRDATRQDEKIRSIIASLEGMNRFALLMGLVTPAESRQMYAEAMKRGLYEGRS